VQVRTFPPPRPTPRPVPRPSAIVHPHDCPCASSFLLDGFSFRIVPSSSSSFSTSTSNSTSNSSSSNSSSSNSFSSSSSSFSSSSFSTATATATATVTATATATVTTTTTSSSSSAPLRLFVRRPRVCSPLPSPLVLSCRAVSLVENPGVVHPHLGEGTPRLPHFGNSLSRRHLPPTSAPHYARNTPTHTNRDKFSLSLVLRPPLRLFLFHVVDPSPSRRDIALHQRRLTPAGSGARSPPSPGCALGVPNLSTLSCSLSPTLRRTTSLPRPPPNPPSHPPHKHIHAIRSSRTRLCSLSLIFPREVELGHGYVHVAATESNNATCCNRMRCCCESLFRRFLLSIGDRLGGTRMCIFSYVQRRSDSDTGKLKSHYCPTPTPTPRDLRIPTL
jgi:hypothetical protein